MPEELDITNSVMDKIRQGKLKMRPKIYFVLGSIFAMIGLVASVIVSVFFISLTRFALRSHGPMGQLRLEQLLSSFPWWAPIIAIAGLVAGLWFLRRYDFWHKKRFLVVIAGFVAAILIAGWIIDLTGLDQIWLRHGPMQGIMRQYNGKNNIQSGPVCGGCLNQKVFTD
ncbi:MAG: hypothetical protein WCV92_00845 [Candidatus Buchananbacteria bacterium]